MYTERTKEKYHLFRYRVVYMTICSWSLIDYLCRSVYMTDIVIIFRQNEHSFRVSSSSVVFYWWNTWWVYVVVSCQLSSSLLYSLVFFFIFLESVFLFLVNSVNMVKKYVFCRSIFWSFLSLINGLPCSFSLHVSIIIMSLF